MLASDAMTFDQLSVVAKQDNGSNVIWRCQILWILTSTMIKSKFWRKQGKYSEKKVSRVKF